MDANILVNEDNPLISIADNPAVTEESSEQISSEIINDIVTNVVNQLQSNIHDQPLPTNDNELSSGITAGSSQVIHDNDVLVEDDDESSEFDFIPISHNIDNNESSSSSQRPQEQDVSTVHVPTNEESLPESEVPLAAVQQEMISFEPTPMQVASQLENPFDFDPIQTNSDVNSVETQEHSQAISVEEEFHDSVVIVQTDDNQINILQQHHQETVQTNIPYETIAYVSDISHVSNTPEESDTFQEASVLIETSPNKETQPESFTNSENTVEESQNEVPPYSEQSQTNQNGNETILSEMIPCQVDNVPTEMPTSDNNTAMETDNNSSAVYYNPEDCFETVKITIHDYYTKLKEKNVMFEVGGEKCPIVGYVEKESELYLTLQGEKIQYLVAPDSFDLKVSSEIAHIINDSSPQSYGKLIKLNFPAENNDDKQQSQQQPPQTNGSASAKNNTKKENIKDVTDQNAKIVTRRIVRVGDLKNVLTNKRVLQPRKPMPKTTIEVLGEAPDDDFDDEAFFNAKEVDDPPSQNTKDGVSSQNNTPSIQSKRLNGSRIVPSNSSLQTFSSTITKKAPVPLNSLTSSTKTYARTGSALSQIRSGTISSVTVRNPNKRLDFSDDSPVTSKRLKTPNNKYTDEYFCYNCNDSFIYFDAYCFHQKYCSSTDKPSHSDSIQRNNFIQQCDSDDVSLNGNDNKDDTFNDDIEENSDTDKKSLLDEVGEEEEGDDDDDYDEEDDENDADTQLNGFRENDLVWVPTKSGQVWPAFVMNLWVTDKSAEVQLIHSTSKKSTHKLPINSLEKYDQGVTKIKRKSLKDNKKLFEAFQASEQYLKKKILDENVNPYVFFNALQTSSSPLKTEAKNHLNIDYRKVVSLIKNGKVEAHLLGIYKDTIDCERHRKWKDNQDDNENHTGFGPIDDEELQDELRTYCTNLFVNNFGNDSVDDLIRYMMNVWIPEAIVRSISKCYNIDVNQAETYIS